MPVSFVCNDDENNPLYRYHQELNLISKIVFQSRKNYVYCLNDVIDFYLDNKNQLYLKKEGHNPQILISDKLDITNLEFEYFASSSELVKINLTVSYNTLNPEYQYSYSLTSSAGIRE